MNCPRCANVNTMYPDDGDLACFACGHRVYRTKPLPPLQSDRRADGTVRQKAREYGKYG